MSATDPNRTYFRAHCPACAHPTQQWREGSVVHCLPGGHIVLDRARAVAADGNTRFIDVEPPDDPPHNAPSMQHGNGAAAPTLSDLQAAAQQARDRMQAQMDARLQILQLGLQGLNQLSAALIRFGATAPEDREAVEAAAKRFVRAAFGE